MLFQLGTMLGLAQLDPSQQPYVTSLRTLLKCYFPPLMLPFTLECKGPVS